MQNLALGFGVFVGLLHLAGSTMAGRSYNVIAVSRRLEAAVSSNLRPVFGLRLYASWFLACASRVRVLMCEDMCIYIYMYTLYIYVCILYSYLYMMFVSTPESTCRCTCAHTWAKALQREPVGSFSDLVFC